MEQSRYFLPFLFPEGAEFENSIVVLPADARMLEDGAITVNTAKIVSQRDFS